MPTMNVSLTAEMADFVEAEVSSGDYVSASEVVRDALRIMRHEKEQQEIKLSLLRDEIDRGYHQMEKGEFSDRSIDEIAQAARREREV